MYADERFERVRVPVGAPAFARWATAGRPANRHRITRGLHIFLSPAKAARHSSKSDGGHFVSITRFGLFSFTYQRFNSLPQWRDWQSPELAERQSPELVEGQSPELVEGQASQQTSYNKRASNLPLPGEGCAP